MAPPVKDKEQLILRERLTKALDPELVPLMTTVSSTCSCQPLSGCCNAHKLTATGPVVQSVPRYLRLFSYFATGFAGIFLALEGYQRWTRKHEGAQPEEQKAD